MNKELSEYEKELGEQLGKVLQETTKEVFNGKGKITDFPKNIEKTLIGVKFIKELDYEWIKEKAKGITDNRKVLVYDKTFKTYGILSVYGLSINFVIKNNPNNFILYQLW